MHDALETGIPLEETIDVKSVSVCHQTALVELRFDRFIPGTPLAYSKQFGLLPTARWTVGSGNALIVEVDDRVIVGYAKPIEGTDTGQLG